MFIRFILSIIIDYFLCFIVSRHEKICFMHIQLLPKIFLDSDFCHNYLHTPVVLN